MDTPEMSTAPGPLTVGRDMVLWLVPACAKSARRRLPAVADERWRPQPVPAPPRPSTARSYDVRRELERSSWVPRPARPAQPRARPGGPATAPLEEVLRACSDHEKPVTLRASPSGSFRMGPIGVADILEQLKEMIYSALARRRNGGCSDLSWRVRADHFDAFGKGSIAGHEIVVVD